MFATACEWSTSSACPRVLKLPRCVEASPEFPTYGEIAQLWSLTSKSPPQPNRYTRAVSNRGRTQTCSMTSLWPDHPDQDRAEWVLYRMAAAVPAEARHRCRARPAAQGEESGSDLPPGLGKLPARPIGALTESAPHRTGTLVS